jgi:hypothetical protein
MAKARGYSWKDQGPKGGTIIARLGWRDFCETVAPEPAYHRYIFITSYLFRDSSPQLSFRADEGACPYI